MELKYSTIKRGRLQGHSYPQRAAKLAEPALEGTKIDFYDAKNKVVPTK